MQTLEDKAEWAGVTSERLNAVAGGVFLCKRLPLCTEVFYNCEYRAGQYAEAMKEVGGQLGLPVLDLWTGLQQLDSWQSLLSDGLHFAPQGQRAVSKLVQEAINTYLPALRHISLTPLLVLLKWADLATCGVLQRGGPAAGFCMARRH